LRNAELEAELIEEQRLRNVAERRVAHARSKIFAAINRFDWILYDLRQAAQRSNDAQLARTVDEFQRLIVALKHEIF